MTTPRNTIQDPTTRQLVVGVTGSGKSQYAEHVIRQSPRVLMIDPMAEHPSAVDFVSTLGVLREVTMEREQEFFVRVSLSGEDVAALAEWLIPAPGTHTSFARCVGGLLLVIDEADLFARSGERGGREIRGLFRRGRHHLLSVMSLSQAPRNLDKECSAMADTIVAYQLYEPRDVQYLESAAPGIMRYAEHVWTRPYHAVIARRRDRTFSEMDEGYHERLLTKPQLSILDEERTR